MNRIKVTCIIRLSGGGGLEWLPPVAEGTHVPIQTAGVA